MLIIKLTIVFVIGARVTGEIIKIGKLISRVIKQVISKLNANQS